MEKHGTSAPFVHWSALEESTLQLALACIPVEHLKLSFARLLDDLGANSTGFPDLVQFFVAARTYKFIEVKGPGDRVRDNQRRWLQFCARHRLPVEVCHVSWA
ncbi:VRR-NUC domain-containing protein [Peristeroidobacter soli]|uniref:VRR-NUC domain-containing protein n=1 Tax=Peristeroidobacter soli TaxID=2497877 RepID=UPI00130083AE